MNSNGNAFDVCNNSSTTNEQDVVSNHKFTNKVGNLSSEFRLLHAISKMMHHLLDALMITLSHSKVQP